MKDLLRGISIFNSHPAPANICRLAMLDRDPETGAAFKKLIAKFAGVPLGAELHMLLVASLRRLGF
jgi:hypothetical protein